MQQRQLETFLRVAECGSFSKTGEKLFISASAVNQQITALETQLDAQLFERTAHGVKLTAIGEYFQQEIKELLEKEKSIRNRIAEMKYEQENCIILGNGLRQENHLFFDLWQEFRKAHPQYRIRFVDVDEFIMSRDLSKAPDLVESVNYGGDFWEDYSFLLLGRTPLVCAVPASHPLASKKLLTYEDMRPWTLVLNPKNLDPVLDRLADEAVANGVAVKHAGRYDFQIFSECRVNGWIMQIPQIWENLLPGFVMIPCQWDYKLDYGFFYRQPMSVPVREFITYARTAAMKDE